MPPLLLLLALAGVIALLVLIPTRRLYLAGWSQRTLLLYFLGMLAFGLLVAELRGPARFLVPILVVAYIAPFVVASEGMARLMGRQRRRPEVRDVTPPPSLIEGAATRFDEPDDSAGPAGDDASAADRQDRDDRESSGDGPEREP